MDALKDNPTQGTAMKRCSGCRRQKPAVMGKYFGSHRSAWDGLARQCLECTRAADRRRKPRHEAQKRRRRKRNKRREQAEAVAYSAKGKPRLSVATPYPAEVVEDLSRQHGRERSVGLLASHLRNCKTSNNREAVRQAIAWVLNATAEHEEANRVDLSLLTQDELARRLQKLMASCPN